MSGLAAAPPLLPRLADAVVLSAVWNTVDQASSASGVATWEWWAVLLLGLGCAVVVVAVIMSVVLLVWVCCPCQSCCLPPVCLQRRRGTAAGTDVESSVAVSRAPSIFAAPLSSTGQAPVSPTKEHSHVGNPFVSPPHPAAPATTSGTRTSAPPAEMVGSAWASVLPTSSPQYSALTRSTSQTDQDAEVRLESLACSESPVRRLRRHQSIVSHMDDGLSRDESIRLHFLRHADTSIPEFGPFLEGEEHPH
ncbi:hypothetical protein NESM_000218000 [Novymonas esmeraldas]|uniref:Uncharacterized protein n=1 Tax=Novymonas esmeraldas TaxID=1808958 RepID=A0AAW0F5U2_9TRYP